MVQINRDVLIVLPGGYWLEVSLKQNFPPGMIEGKTLQLREWVYKFASGLLPVTPVLSRRLVMRIWSICPADQGPERSKYSRVSVSH